MQIALHLIFGALEAASGYTEGAITAVLLLRLATVVSLVIFSLMTLDKRFHGIIDPLALGSYMVSGVRRQPPRMYIRV